MKTLTALTESIANGSFVPGVANHYTPIQNIITNVKNLFAFYFGLVVEPGEDGVSIKIHNSEFTDPDKIYKILYKPVDRYTSVASYIESQGLNSIKLVNIGKFYVVYFCPTDIASAENPEAMCSDKEKCPKCNQTPCVCDDEDCAPCSEQLQYNIEEAELHSITEAVDWDGEEEMEDKTKEEVAEIINMDDKIKAAVEFAEKLSHVIELPEGFYIKAVKDQDGRESIALRQKTTKRRPFGKSVEVVKSLINIYSTDHEGIWVDPFEHKEILDETTLNIIEQILAWIGASETSDPCVYNWEEESKEQVGNNEDDNEDKNNDGDDETANGNEEVTEPGAVETDPLATV